MEGAETSGFLHWNEEVEAKEVVEEERRLAEEEEDFPHPQPFPTTPSWERARDRMPARAQEQAEWAAE